LILIWFWFIAGFENAAADWPRGVKDSIYIEVCRERRVTNSPDNLQKMDFALL